MKFLLVLAMIGVVFISACSADLPQNNYTNNNINDDNEESDDGSNITGGGLPEGEDVGNPTLKKFDISARKWEFEPDTIVVNKGDMVKLSITSEDVTHGFSLMAFDINEDLEPGETVNVEFVADKRGTFTFSCSVYCGSGHGGMKGTLIVE